MERPWQVLNTGWDPVRLWVILWRDRVQRRGVAALQARPAPGRPPKLRAKQVERLPRLLVRGAMAWGFSTELWTTQRIATVIRREFGVRLHRAHVSRLLSRLGWSCQKPERRASERDEVAIAQWKRYRWTAIKKKRAASTRTWSSSTSRASC